MIDPLTNPAYIIFAAISPLLIALIKQQGFSSEFNAIIAFIGYIVVGIVGALVSGTALTIENAVELVTIATVVGSAAYSLIWSNLGTGPNGEAPSLDERITDATSVVK